jgi:phage baseplate assembly protein W
VKTLLLDNGDLVLGAGTFATVSGSPKLVQDLGVAMREPIGCDRFHPQWGSTLINYVGEPVDDQTRFAIVAEVQRIIDNFTTVQRYYLDQDSAAGSTSRYKTTELIQDLKSVQVRQELTASTSGWS